MTPPPNHHLHLYEIYLNPLLALYCNAFDISVWDKEYLVTVFNKVAHFEECDCTSYMSYSESSESSESLDCSSESLVASLPSGSSIC